MATPQATPIVAPLNTRTPQPTVTPSPIPTLTPTPDFRITNPENQHLYLLVNTPKRWQPAIDYCSSMGAHLATIQSAAENQFVSRLAAAMWLGASDEAQEGIWVWITGETWTYSGWDLGEPNNCCPAQFCGPEECTDETYLTTDINGGWNDTPDGENYFVCEWEPIP